MYILGLSSYYHDSAAALIKNGKVICAAEEERFTRVKHDNSFPINAINFCLKYADINISQINKMAYYEKPLLKFERILETFVETYPKSFLTFIKGIPEWLDYKIKVEKTIKQKTGYKGKIYYIPHHLSHASVAFLASPFKRAAILTIDGVGDCPTTQLWIGEGTKITPLKVINFPHSLGLLYSTFTSFLGFKVNNDEYKVMGLAAYGRPRYVDRIRKTIDLKEDGSFSLNLKYFSFRESFKMWSSKFEEEFGKPRSFDGKITKRDKDLAASVQQVTEEVYFKILNYLYRITKVKNLCIGGGVALNSLANGKIYQNTPFVKIHIFGSAGDSGAALGSALYTYHAMFGNKKRERIKDLYVGGSYNDIEIEDELIKASVKYKKYKTYDKLLKKVASELKKNKIIGWFNGRMELGPRALGARSILANPKNRYMKDKVNKIKRREEFRPFAGSVLQDKVSELFEVPEKNHYSPFMNFCFKVKKDKQYLISAIVHEDKTCRIQTVNKDNGLYYELIKEFYRLTGISCILNTSFNLNKEPIVQNPKQAIEDFIETEIDYLILGNYVVRKPNHKE